MQISRTDEIIVDVMANRNGIWDAYDQGRWAFTVGTKRGDNPHLMPGQPDYFHVNMTEWFRGWDNEQRANEAGV